MIALFAITSTWFLRFWWKGRRLLARQAAEARAAVPELLELLVVLVRSGLTPVLAFTELAGFAPDPHRPAIAEVVERVRCGERFADALDALQHRHAGLLGTLAGVLAHADRHGDPLGPVLDRLAAEARQERRRAAEADARRLPVRLCFPLACCTLPAFVVLTIVPMLLGTFSSMSGVAP